MLLSQRHDATTAGPFMVIYFSRDPDQLSKHCGEIETHENRFCLPVQLGLILSKLSYFCSSFDFPAVATC